MRRIVKSLLTMAGVAILALMVWVAGPRQLWDNIVAMPGELAVIIGVWGVGYLLNGISWASIIGIYPMRKPLSPFEIYRHTVAGFALNYITPFGLLGGEPYRVYALKPAMGVEAATSSVVLYMMMHVCSHFMLWLLSCLLAVVTVSSMSGAMSAVLATVAVVCLTALFMFMKGYRNAGVGRLVEHIGHWPLIGAKVEAWRLHQQQRLATIDRGITLLLLSHPRRFYASLGIELLSRIFNCLEYWVIFRALGADVQFAGAVLVVAFSSLFANLLFFTPLQLGTREGGILLALQFIGLEAPASELLSLAVTMSIMTRIREYAWIAIGLAFARISDNNRK